jgi:hypothetical protein
VVDVLRNKCRNFKLAGATIRRDYGGVKKAGRGESVGAVIHVYMETTQGNSLCSYL